MSSIDELIRDDAATLARKTTVADDFAPQRERLLGSGEPYRDSQVGLQHRREASLEERRVELALLPLTLQRLFIHRTGRAVAGGVAVLGGVALWAVVALPVFDLYIVMDPRITIDLALAGAVAGVLAGYLAGIVLGERLLERAVRASITPTWDALADVHRDGPAAEARRLAGRVDGLAVGLPLVGLALLAPLLVFVSVLYLDGVRSAYMNLLYFNDAQGLLARNLVYIAVAVAFAVTLSIAVARGCVREESRLVAVLAHWGALMMAALVGSLIVVVGGRAFFDLYVNGIAPSVAARWSLAVGGVAALFLPCVWAVLVLRRRELRLLDAQ